MLQSLNFQFLEPGLLEKIKISPGPEDFTHKTENIVGVLYVYLWFFNFI